MEIAIIDDGVSGLHFPNLAFQMKVEEEKVAPTVDRSVRWEHGSTCAAIIRKYVPEARLGSIQILDKTTERGNIADFLAALAWCAEHEIKLVHASLGSIASEDYEPLRKAMAEARRHGMIVVAACKNGLRCAYPASLEDTVGVKTDEILCEDAYRVNHGVAADGIEFIASSRHTLPYKRWEDEEKWITTPSNSYAAPLITAKIWKLLIKHPDLGLQEIKAALGAFPTKTWWECVPKSPEAEQTTPVVWVMDDVPEAFCDALAEKFHAERYAPLVLSAEEYVPDFLRKAAELAELRHLDLVIVRGAFGRLCTGGGLLPDIALVLTTPTRTWRDEEIAWISIKDEAPDRVSDKVFAMLSREENAET